ncbi:uncharacterized protein N7477_003003 [Penicillium maclennaniae]|uniref:uncharacterized protein n=1 Tax=Penicillium maclennaniae TaxID=1343394 RepID=UPI00253FFC70|nr:uncharacterized protein N7477_003003 [Penicillium maclennaniae]KAJ5677370.1 hypothetical protein N7477_003003 [Penicillium maclennaniae]
MFCKNKASYELRAQSTESQTSVSGRFCISLRQNVNIKSIKVRLRGILKIPGDGFLVSEAARHCTFEQEQPIASSRCRRSFPMAAGDYKYPFSIPLPADISDSSLGPNKYHTYKVEAVIKRPYLKDIVISQPVQIYKFNSELENPDSIPYIYLREESQTEHGQGLNSRIILPSRYIPFGSAFPVNVTLWTGSGKETTLSKITIEVIEKHNLKVDATAAQSARYNIHTIHSARSYTLVSKMLEFADSPKTDWNICKMMRLPQALDKASQSINTKAIKIEHVLVVKAEFRSDDGNNEIDVEYDWIRCVGAGKGVAGLQYSASGVW